MFNFSKEIENIAVKIAAANLPLKIDPKDERAAKTFDSVEHEEDNRLTISKNIDEEMLITIEDTIRKFMGLGYTIRKKGVSPSILAQEVLSHPAEFKIFIDLADLKNPTKSYIAESEIIKNLFYDAIIFSPPHPDFNKLILDIAKICRHQNFYYKSLKFKVSDEYENGERKFIVNIKIGDQDYEFTPEGFYQIGSQILNFLNSIISQPPYNMNLLRIENTRNFIVLAKSEIPIFTNMQWKFTNNYGRDL